MNVHSRAWTTPSCSSEVRMAGRGGLRTALFRNTALRHGSNARLRVARASSMDPSTAAVAERLLQKEAQLKALFKSGQPMPKAGAVTQLRKEIAEIREELNQIVGDNGGQDAGAVAGLPLAAEPAGGNGAASTPSSSSINSVLSQVVAERARKALREVERTLTSVAGLNNSSRLQLAEEELLELDVLEAENNSLRSRASGLLRRQQFLEQELQRHHLVPATTGDPDAMALMDLDHNLEQLPPSYSKDATVVMRAPSYY